MKSLPLSLALVAALSLSPAAFAHEGHDAMTPAATAASTVSAKQAATQGALRDLWVEHVFWIRNYVVASHAHDANAQKVATAQVIANATSIAGAVGSFYGKPAGDRMLTLLGGHWGAVRAYSDATFANDAKGQAAATATLLANAKDIAAFLAKANPNLPEATLIGLLSAHGAHHIAQIQQLAQGDDAAEAKTWAAMRAHMFAIADALTGALAKQFPAKF